MRPLTIFTGLENLIVSNEMEDRFTVDFRIHTKQDHVFSYLYKDNYLKIWRFATTQLCWYLFYSSTLFFTMSLIDLTLFIISHVWWSLVLREFRCFLVTMTRIFFMNNSFPIVLSDLFDFPVSSGSTVSFLDVSSCSLLEYFAWITISPVC